MLLQWVDEESMTEAHHPTVTIALPTVNRLAYLRLALQGALAQTYPNLEIVVANNASTDGTAEYLAGVTDPRVRVLHHPSRLPMVDNWNTCIAASSAEFLLLLSDDDLLRPAAIEKMVEAYRQPDSHGNAPGFVYCGGSIIDAAGDVTRRFSASPPVESAKQLALGFFNGQRDLWLCAILFRRSDLASGFSTQFAWAPDTEAWIRAAFRAGFVRYVDEPLVDYRVHRNITASLPLDTWQREINALPELAIAHAELASGPDPAFAAQLRQTVRDMVARSLPVKINSMFRSDRSKALGEYWRRRAAMLHSSQGHHVLAGIAFLLLPQELRPWLGRNLRRLRSAH